MNEIPTETLLRIHNAVAAVFYVENADPQTLGQTLDELMTILSGEASELFDVFGRWLSNYLAGTAGEAAVVEPIRSVWEIKSMFATKLREYGERLKEEARKEALQEGRREGHREGRTEGRREGRQEARLQTARSLKEQGVDGAVIARSTGLSLAEIDAL